MVAGADACAQIIAVGFYGAVYYVDGFDPALLGGTDTGRLEAAVCSDGAVFDIDAYNAAS